MRANARRAARALFVMLVMVDAGTPARANMYSYIDADGIVHFTNIEPPKGKKNRWRLLPNGLGRAATGGVEAAPFSSVPGCKNSRVDVVGAKDRSPERYTRYDPLISAASRMYAIPESLIRAIIKVESDYDPRVVSCAGAKGLMQVMPYEEKSEHIEHVFDPWQNIAAATRVLRRNANHWSGDLVKTIASYHAGVGAVTKYHGVPPYSTTQFYVRSVLKHYEKYRQREPAAP